MTILERQIILNLERKNSLLVAWYEVKKEEVFSRIKLSSKELYFTFSPEIDRTFNYKIEFEKKINKEKYYLGKTNNDSEIFLNILPSKKWIIKDNKLNKELEAIVYFTIYRKNSIKPISHPFFLKTETQILAEQRIHQILYENPSLVWMENATKIENLI